MRPQPAADTPSPTPPPSSPALLNRIDFFFLQGCERRLGALQGAKNPHADGGHNNWSGSQLIRQTRRNYCTGTECQGNPWRSVSIKALLDRCLSADWLITLTSPLCPLIFSFFSPPTMEGKWGCFGGKAIRKTSCKSVWKVFFLFF